ncbi:hypothetical protein BU16DRAFT_226579 [Lophium mytilinum]|uniref:UspA domain-containing protein n=1 Tax=Lophium mytilinum TaxID=390894 RepID=A0A6A6Q7R7_9PEZI|nr:hypothetical protein BU16DRAFT_226579 [Lophium mytilinum]
MSLESALDEERREVMALLEGRASVPRPRRTDSPGARGQSPAAAASPVRSMLDIGPHPPRSMLDVGPTSGRSASVAGQGAGITRPRVGSGSILNPSSPPRSPNRVPGSPPPVVHNAIDNPNTNPEASYNFDMMPTIEARSMPLRVTQGGKKPKNAAMASVYGHSTDILGTSRDKNARHNSTGGLLGKKSSSPHAGRSASPGLNTNSFNPMTDPNKFVLDSGKVMDMQSAYRRLSDAALMRSGGTLSKLPVRKGSDPTRGETLAPGGGVRLAIDDENDGDEGAVESSADDADSDGSDSDRWGSEKGRGRRRSRVAGKTNSDPGKKKAPKSLLAAAEEERIEVGKEVYKVRSLLEPQVTVTGPDGERMTTKGKSGVHPHTNFDSGGGSGLSTPVSSDTEADLSEIKTAQMMSMSISPIDSSPEAHRCVRQIVRGNWRKFQEDAEAGLRRQRVYLVATDVSEEAAYALEWTIGTVLRDGDTLLAVYAVDEDTGTGAEAGVGIGQGATAQQETASLMKVLSTPQHVAGGLSPGPSPLSQHMSFSEPNFNNMQKTEKERYQAAVEVSDRCVKLLRKTRLQVRVVVEVFHCKSPKHMLTEVIDFLEPTLVILGSRGRSALKGVLLGSFSNYLVTKSSVPVMVARKRLRKHSKYKRKNIRMSNVLTSPNSRLATAKID